MLTPQRAAEGLSGALAGLKEAMTARPVVSGLLISGGLVLLGAAGLHYFRGFQAQREGRQTFQDRREAAASRTSSAPATPAAPAAARENPGIEGAPAAGATPAESYPWGQPIAKIRIPSAEIDFVVFGGADESTLEKGPGHVPGTEMPGEVTGRGNCVITGHRDSHFRHLGWLRAGHRIELETPSGGTTAYRVVSREIVTPDTVRVLQPTEKPRLTLVTCYPFNYVGSAPKRLIVVAEPVQEASKLRHSS